jgi:hypothetical protein
VNDRKWRIPAFDLEQHVITVDSSRYGSCYQTVQSMFRKKFRRQLGREKLSPFLQRIRDDPPRNQYFDIFRNGHGLRPATLLHLHD